MVRNELRKTKIEWKIWLINNNNYYICQNSEFDNERLFELHFIVSVVLQNCLYTSEFIVPDSLRDSETGAHIPDGHS